MIQKTTNKPLVSYEFNHIYYSIFEIKSLKTGLLGYGLYINNDDEIAYWAELGESKVTYYRNKHVIDEDDEIGHRFVNDIIINEKGEEFPYEIVFLSNFVEYVSLD